MQLHKLYAEKSIKNPACIVDCNHANSGKQYLEQIRIANRGSFSFYRILIYSKSASSSTSFSLFSQPRQASVMLLP